MTNGSNPERGGCTAS